jgi:hypothetical protein
LAFIVLVPSLFLRIDEKKFGEILQRFLWIYAKDFKGNIDAESNQGHQISNMREKPMKVLEPLHGLIDHFSSFSASITHKPIFSCGVETQEPSTKPRSGRRKSEHKQKRRHQRTKREKTTI